MRSSSSLPDLPEDSVLSDAGAWLLVIAIGLVPLFWLPVFQSGFEVPRRALVLMVIGPLATLLIARNWAQRIFVRVPILCLLVIIAAGILPHPGSFDLHQAWRSVRYLAPVITLILAGAALMHPGFNHRLHLALVVPAIPVLVIGVARRLLGIPAILPDRPDVWISSTLGNSNELGEAFVPVFLAGLVLAPGMPTRTQRVLMRTGTACALALVVLSHSRGAWLALAAGLAVQVALWCRSHRDDRDRLFRALVVFLLAVIVFFVFLGLPAGHELRQTLRSFVSTTHPTNVVRLATWSATSEVVGDSLPFGVGLGGFEAAFLPHRRAVEWDLSGADTRVDNPHQEFLWIASETGILGAGALILLLLVALRRATRPEDSLTHVMRHPQRALLIVTVALIVLSLFRSPWHHPSGVLVFATLLGSVAPRFLSSRRLRLEILAVPLLGAFIVLAALDASEDLALGRAVTALNEGKAAGAEGRRENVAALLSDSGRRLRSVRSAILKDFDRTFRAALAAGELADLKDALRAASPGDSFPDLPDQQEVLELLEEVLRLLPNHPGATKQLALLWLKQGHVARAEGILKDAVRALPEAPQFRHNLAAIYANHDRFGDAFRWMQEEIARRPNPTAADRVRLASLSLGLGRDEASFGRYLAAVAPASSPQLIAEGALPTERRKALLLHLLERPDDGLALADLAQVDYSLAAAGGPAADLGPEGNRAYARSRARFAVEALETGDLGRAESYLKLALQKDAGLLDALFLRAKVAARGAKPEVVAESLRSMLDRAMSREGLRSWIERDPDLAPFLGDGRLKALGL